MRNRIAKEIGFSSYPDLVLETDEIEKKSLIKLLNQYLNKNLPKAKEIIKKYNISWENWFVDLEKIGFINTTYSPIEFIDRLFKILGLEDLKNTIKVTIKEEWYAGFAAALSPTDVRIVVKPIKSLRNLKVLFHEIGHAIMYSLNEQEGLYRVLPASLDEAMAVVMECIASELLLSELEREKVYEIIVLEYTLFAISALFEFELWDNPYKAEELYIKHYSKLGIKIDDPCIWAFDSFRSIDPVYIQNYVIGAVLAEKLMEYFYDKYSNKYKEWGNWLYKNIYLDGRKRSFKEKVKALDNFI
ncbi:hypothetical protein [Caloranaerobacter sp. DY30410]|uniref:hypothetical protein n=1 Tax=Caloranaerobacter sp. DY30410 TaxID=3238305 RepID=UPI003D0181DD